MQSIGYLQVLIHEPSNGQRTFPLVPTGRSSVAVYRAYLGS
jgi:hypothetical protein